MKRLFVAIAFPDSVTSCLVRLNPHLSGVGWLPPAKMHLTVSFLGNVAPRIEEALRERLAAIHFNAFFLPVVGMGSFPAKGRPRVIWAGVGAGHPQLYHVHKRVQEAALNAGLEPDLRSWHPHITVARCHDVSAETVRPFLKRTVDFDAGLVRVESFSLYSSRLGPSGSAYTRELEVRAAT